MVAASQCFVEAIAMKAIGKIAGGQCALILVFGGMVLLSIGSSPPLTETQPVSADTKAVGEGNCKFTLNLFSTLPQSGANQVISPLSVSSVFAIAYEGARGPTKEQIASVLQFPTNQASLQDGMAGVLSRLTNMNSSDVELKVRNGLWSLRGYQIAPGFMDLCRGKYGTDIDFADFRTSARASSSRINAWAEQNTKGKIRNLFAPDSITSDTRLVLANAVYFKGKWASQFDKGKTRTKPFWVNPERPVQVPTMAQKSVFLYFSNDSAQIIELPYRGSELSMIVLLPQGKGGLTRLEAELTLNTFTNWIDRMYRADVDVLLPKFRIDSRFSLGQSLASLGVRDAFDEARANFSGITSDRPFFISSVEHGAVIEVDEEGTVAAAATGASFGCAAKPMPAIFHADHPFLFIIFDRPTRMVLFVGRVANPGA